jgi:predicted transcriptional regulator
MEITLTPHAEELLRSALARHPGQSPAEVLEQALAESVKRESAVEASSQPPKAKGLTPEEFNNWLESFSRFSEKIPPMTGETFSREMIYQDHG